MRIVLLPILALMIAASCSESVPPESRLYGDAANFEADQQYNKAIDTYDLIITSYPQSPNRYKAIFMKGYIYTDLLKDKNKALEAFDQLLKEYPDCDLADDAVIMKEIAEKGADLLSVFQDSLDSK